MRSTHPRPARITHVAGFQNVPASIVCDATFEAVVVIDKIAVVPMWFVEGAHAREGHDKL